MVYDVHGDRSTTTAEHVQRWRRRRSFSFYNRVLRFPAIVFVEHDVSTRKLGPSSGIRPSFLTDPFILLSCYV